MYFRLANNSTTETEKFRNTGDLLYTQKLSVSKTCVARAGAVVSGRCFAADDEVMNSDALLLQACDRMI